VKLVNPFAEPGLAVGDAVEEAELAAKLLRSVFQTYAPAGACLKAALRRDLREGKRHYCVWLDMPEA
jgi:hypothetical protein